MNWTCTVGGVTLVGMELSGIYVPLVTPFAEDGTVAERALAELAHAVLAEGAAGIVALGTTAEASASTPGNAGRSSTSVPGSAGSGAPP